MHGGSSRSFFTCEAPLRDVRDNQLPLISPYHAHVKSQELAAMEKILDATPEAAKWVLADLVGRGGNRVSSKKGREGMSGEQVLRAMLLKQWCGYSFDDLAFHLADSISYRAFCQIKPGHRSPSGNSLQRNVKLVQPATLARINALLISYAKATDVEDGNCIRADCTVIESNIHAPTDSSLLFDAVRVLTRWIVRAQEYVAVVFTNHQRRAKRRALGVCHGRDAQRRRKPYQDLLHVTRETVSAAQRAVDALSTTNPRGLIDDFKVAHVKQSLVDNIALAKRVIDQFTQVFTSRPMRS